MTKILLHRKPFSVLLFTCLLLSRLVSTINQILRKRCFLIEEGLFCRIITPFSSGNLTVPIKFNSCLKSYKWNINYPIDSLLLLYRNDYEFSVSSLWGVGVLLVIYKVSVLQLFILKEFCNCFISDPKKQTYKQNFYGLLRR